MEEFGLKRKTAFSASSVNATNVSEQEMEHTLARMIANARATSRFVNAGFSPARL